ncbi:F-box protein VBF-like [Diospyros lotus]|uniref:F-box protein VBF-like n=1 Tax=Diospyros lotus TaxID=55363 RepID=UPI00224F25B3|nr:F-box protein VBF-like [Diospyros lotus]
MLPEDCVSTILSLTSPPDASRSALVSAAFRSAADSDVVWERFLPPDYRKIVAASVTPMEFSSKKELFFRLCNPAFIDGGNKMVKLDKLSGKKYYMLSARELSISQSNEPSSWSWKSMPESRFESVAVLITASRIEIKSSIRTRILSPNTNYGAYLIVKISETSYGLDSIPSEISIQAGSSQSYGTAFLSRPSKNKLQMESLFYSNRMHMLRQRVERGDEKAPRERDDGWTEIELGEFFSGEGDDEVKTSLREVKGGHLKGGFIVEGIELRPKSG